MTRKIQSQLAWLALVGLCLAAAIPSCTTEAYCFVCDGDPLNPTAAGGNAGTTVNPLGVGGVLTGVGGNADAGGEGGTPEGGQAGATECEGIDYDTDVRNCSFCGRQCLLEGAVPKCVGGECLIDSCLPGRQDLNGLNDDGCESICIETNGGVEACDGLDNDCDGLRDEDFDLTGVDNCGGCGTVCLLSHATPICVEVGTEYRCRVDECEDGFHDVDGLDSTGCEYQCEETNGGVEICDGLDNDCNGQFDEEAPNAGQPCDGPWCLPDNCNAACSMQGVTVCNGTALICVLRAGATLPGIEICDVAGSDEDCDGDSNEGFNTQTDAANCGACGNVCNLPNAISRCATGTCEVDRCVNGFADLTAAPGCEYECPPGWGGPEVCDGIDNDCDGQIDEAQGMVTPANFCAQTGPCAGTTMSCTNGQWRCNYADQDSRITLNPLGGSQPETLCDDFDNNCNSRIDEGLGRYQFCTSGAQCIANCNQGRCTCSNDSQCDFGYACSDGFCSPQCFDGVGACQEQATVTCDGNGVGTVCTAEEDLSQASNETCDGVDNNCDGQVDERNPAAGNSFQGVRDEMVQVGSVWVYKYEASRPDATSTSGGVADARACSKADALPWTSVNRAEAAAACAAISNADGQPMSLCSETQWQNACRASNPASAPSWSFATAATTYASGICNDAAHPRNATTPSAWAGGTGTSCYANLGGANQIFDMSGNVSEWTSTTETVDGTTYYRVRGGNYTAYDTATSCTFDFVLDVETFANADLGFRCCSGAAP